MLSPGQEPVKLEATASTYALQTTCPSPKEQAVVPGMPHPCEQPAMHGTGSPAMSRGSIRHPHARIACPRACGEHRPFHGHRVAVLDKHDPIILLSPRPRPRMRRSDEKIQICSPMSGQSRRRQPPASASRHLTDPASRRSQRYAVVETTQTQEAGNRQHCSHILALQRLTGTQVKAATFFPLKARDSDPSLLQLSTAAAFAAYDLSGPAS